MSSVYRSPFSCCFNRSCRQSLCLCGKHSTPRDSRLSVVPAFLICRHPLPTSWSCHGAYSCWFNTTAILGFFPMLVLWRMEQDKSRCCWADGGMANCGPCVWGAEVGAQQLRLMKRLNPVVGIKARKGFNNSVKSVLSQTCRTENQHKTDRDEDVTGANCQTYKYVLILV